MESLRYVCNVMGSSKSRKGGGGSELMSLRIIVFVFVRDLLI